MTMEFQGKIALVTGAARGQGRSHAIELARRGADIIALDICKPIQAAPYAMGTADDLAETAEQVEKLDRRVITAEVDVRDGATLRSLVEGAAAELGGVDIVVANAGILSFGSPEPDDNDELVVLNPLLTADPLGGVVHCMPRQDDQE
jgi:NAD(P)-dependent dehydrogenase (short-subunit alcohol dehydrogenase family)